MSKLYPSIPEPSQDVRSLQASVLALKEAVEVLSGQRRGTHPPVTWGDLVDLGLIDRTDIPR